MSAAEARGGHCAGDRPVAELISDEVVAALQATLPAGSPAAVELVWEPPWMPDRMSPHVRRFMD